jgi:hypothetical protein
MVVFFYKAWRGQNVIKQKKFITLALEHKTLYSRNKFRSGVS